MRSGCGDLHPTQTVIGVAGLALPDILFEVEAVAAWAWPEGETDTAHHGR